MAHPVTSPALQRIRRLLAEQVRPNVLAHSTAFNVESTEELFEAPTFAEATTLPRHEFAIGSAWGAPWHTRWFKLMAIVPEEMNGRELVAHIDLGFNGRYDGFQAEGLAWIDGSIAQAVQPDRRLVPLGVRKAGESIQIWIEAAATPVIAGHAAGYGPTSLGDPATSGGAPHYQLRHAHLAVLNAEVERLSTMMLMGIDLILDLGEKDPQRARLFAALARVGEVLDRNNVVGTAAQAIAELDVLFNAGKSPAAHRIVATGHAHLDTAWLWPTRETKRKAVRTFANAVRLLERNPEVVYCHSQAQHYEWVRETAPEIFERVKELVAEGRWEPVGGMWVETDLNLPSGESLLRQMTYGQRSFRQWFGVTCNGAFLPDDFGYPGGLPQIVAHGGAEWFFTQKLSWNETNKFPHHTFWWEGIDGTRVFAHFSPIDTYNATLLPSQLRFASRNFLDHVGSSSSLALFGHGDGGGGPTQEMVDRARLSQGLDDVPHVEFGRADRFNEGIRNEYGSIAPVWAGEMYFEKHRGTLSSQIGTKQGNRRSERLLHEAELWSARGSRIEAIDQWWQRVLTQQFHDIIPGSSIAWVHRDAEREHAEIAEKVDEALAGLMVGDAQRVFNSSPVQVAGVIDVEGAATWIEVDALSSSEFAASPLPEAVAPVVVDADSLTLGNGIVKLQISGTGGLAAMSLEGSRSVIRSGLESLFVLRRDTPAEYDAWDIDMADADSEPTSLIVEKAPRVIEESPLRAIVETSYRTPSRRSKFTVRVTLCAASRRVDFSLEADWHERETRLQFVLPTDVFARKAICGTQFGHIERTRVSNTSWDVAMFESCAHRYVHIGEPGRGVAIMADGPRGYDIRGDELKLTLLRSPSLPDPTADEGRQFVEWSVFADDGSRALVECEAAKLAHPIRIAHGSLVHEPGVSLESKGILVSCVKSADDNSGDLVVRVWEHRAAHSSGVLQVEGATGWMTSNALEDAVEGPQGLGEIVELQLRPFEIRTLRFTR